MYLLQSMMCGSNLFYEGVLTDTTMWQNLVLYRVLQISFEIRHNETYNNKTKNWDHLKNL